MRPLRIGTRGSQLALWQARAVATALEHMGACAELVTISTRGDTRQDVPLTAIGGKGVFVKEIHDALLRGDIDLAVHSAKDMAAESPPGLVIAATLKREDPRDALILPVTAGHKAPPCDYDLAGHKAPPCDYDLAGRKAPPYGYDLAGRTAPPYDYDLAGGKAPPYETPEAVGRGFTPRQIENARIGTGSPRRIAQLRRLFPNATFEPIRGNVDTRLRKLDSGDVDALVLACAGLRRLGFGDRISTPLDIDACVPAPGQGIVAVEARRDDERTIGMLTAIDHAPSHAVLAAEQAVVSELGGGCQLPLGAYAEIQGNVLSIRAVVSSPDGADFIQGEASGDSADPVAAGTRLARELASRGARELLNHE